MAYRVLITDDSPAMRSFVRRVIELSGFELSACFEAGDGAEALAVLKNEWVDAILTDINMPGVGGEELLRRLAAYALLGGIMGMVNSNDATQNRIARCWSRHPGLRHQALPAGNSARGTGAHSGGAL
jgi:two-component system chemotaxis response regulator CheY